MKPSPIGWRNAGSAEEVGVVDAAGTKPTKPMATATAVPIMKFHREEQRFPCQCQGIKLISFEDFAVKIAEILFPLPLVE